MDEIERIAKEIFDRFNLQDTGNPVRQIIDQAVRRAKQGDTASAWWILHAFNKGWERGADAFRREYDSAYHRYNEEQSRTTKLVREIGRLEQAVNAFINKSNKY